MCLKAREKTVNPTSGFSLEFSLGFSLGFSFRCLSGFHKTLNLALCVDLRVRGPLGVLLEPLPHLLVAQDVEKPCSGLRLGLSLGCRLRGEFKVSFPV